MVTRSRKSRWSSEIIPWFYLYARCSAKKDDTAIADLEKTYLATADHSITAFRESTQPFSTATIFRTFC